MMCIAAFTREFCENGGSWTWENFIDKCWYINRTVDSYDRAKMVKQSRAIFNKFNIRTRRFIIFLCHYYFIIQVFGRDKKRVYASFETPDSFVIGALMILQAGGYLPHDAAFARVVHESEVLEKIIGTVADEAPMNVLDPSTEFFPSILNDKLFNE